MPNGSSSWLRCPTIVCTVANSQERYVQWCVFAAGAVQVGAGAGAEFPRDPHTTANHYYFCWGRLTRSVHEYSRTFLGIGRLKYTIQRIPVRQGTGR